VVVNGTATATTSRDVALTARSTYYRFIVQHDSAGFNGATVAIGGVSGITAGNGSNAGRVNLTVPETQHDYTVSANGYITVTDTASLGGYTAGTRLDVGPIAIYTIPTISGSTQDDEATPGPVNFTTVYLCEGAAPAATDPACGATGGPGVVATVSQGGTPGPNFTFNTSGLSLAPGAYHVRGVAGTESGTVNFTITATGTALGTLTITLS